MNIIIIIIIMLFIRNNNTRECIVICNKSILGLPKPGLIWHKSYGTYFDCIYTCRVLNFFFTVILPYKT